MKTGKKLKSGPSWSPAPKDHPMNMVTWYDSVKWCNARSEMEGRPPVYFEDVDWTLIYRKGTKDLSNENVNWLGSRAIVFLPKLNGKRPEGEAGKEIGTLGATRLTGLRQTIASAAICSTTRVPPSAISTAIKLFKSRLIVLGDNWNPQGIWRMILGCMI